MRWCEFMWLNNCISLYFPRLIHHTFLMTPSVIPQKYSWKHLRHSALSIKKTTYKSTSTFQLLHPWYRLWGSRPMKNKPRLLFLITTTKWLKLSTPLWIHFQDHTSAQWTFARSLDGHMWDQGFCYARSVGRHNVPVPEHTIKICFVQHMFNSIWLMTNTATTHNRTIQAWQVKENILSIVSGPCTALPLGYDLLRSSVPPVPSVIQ